MHDIKAIRDNPAAYDAGWKSRGLSPQTPTLLLGFGLCFQLPVVLSLAGLAGLVS
ncbi:MAG: hypothetical protein HY859_08970, partial [Caulobacterales bacterium]|nr:hypothetical protein [Caulobacterales bacterium]